MSFFMTLQYHTCRIIFTCKIIFTCFAPSLGSLTFVPCIFLLRKERITIALFSCPFYFAETKDAYSIPSSCSIKWVPSQVVNHGWGKVEMVGAQDSIHCILCPPVLTFGRWSPVCFADIWPSHSVIFLGTLQQFSCLRALAFFWLLCNYFMI